MNTATERLPVRHARHAENGYLHETTANAMERRVLEHYVAEGPAAALAHIDARYGGPAGFGQRFTDLYDKAGARERLRLLELEAKIRGWVSDANRNSGGGDIHVHMSPAPNVLVRGRDRD